jgi:hypothetical protein
MTAPAAPWSRVAAEAPELAAAVIARFALNRHHVIATVRRDGSPRVSGTEVEIDDQVHLGMMVGSRKLADVRRDPRVEIHCAPLTDDPGLGDVKLKGVLVERGPISEPEGTIFDLAIEQVTRVGVEGDELVVTTWQPERGLHVVRRR